MSEIERFAQYLKARIAEGTIACPFTGELLDYELAVNALEFSPRSRVLRELAGHPIHGPDTPCRLHPLARLVHFRHEPLVVLKAAAQGGVPSPDLPEQDAFVIVSVLDGARTVFRVPDEVTALFSGGCDRLTPRLAPPLADAGLLVPL